MATDKKIEPSLKLISEYLKIGEGNCFVIPEYQRAYSWTSGEQCDKLWEDITSFIQDEKKEPYFFGTVIIDASTDGELRLIDGQQRTTTFILLMKALLVRINETICQMPDDEHSLGLKEDLNDYRKDIVSILCRTEDKTEIRGIIADWTKKRDINIITSLSINENDLYKEDVVKILNARTLDDAEQDVYKIARKQKDNKYTNFFRNFKFFYDKLLKNCNDSTSLRLFAEVFLTKCQLIEIRSWQTEQAIMMFNSLNSTGMPLSDADIISAQLSAKSGNEREEFNSQWSTLVELAQRLENNKVVDLVAILQQYMHINTAMERQVDPNKKADVTTEAMRKYYMDSHKQLLDNPLMLCAKLKKLADIWDKVRDFPVVKLALKFNMNIKLFFAAYLFRFDVDAISKEKATIIAECLIRLFAVLELIPEGYSSSRFKIFLFTEIIKLVKEEYTIEQIREDFNMHISGSWSETDIYDYIVNYDKNVLVYLNEYLYSKKKNNKAFDILPSTQVEHIMPLSGHNINAIRYDAGFADDNYGKEQYRSLVDKIGNKILLEEKKNKSIGNEWFVSKKSNEDGYNSSSSAMAKTLANNPSDQWTKEDIAKATDAAADRIVNFIFNKGQ